MRAKGTKMAKWIGYLGGGAAGAAVAIYLLIIIIEAHVEGDGGRLFGPSEIRNTVLLIVWSSIFWILGLLLRFLTKHGVECFSSVQVSTHGMAKAKVPYCLL